MHFKEICFSYDDINIWPIHMHSMDKLLQKNINRICSIYLSIYLYIFLYFFLSFNYSFILSFFSSIYQYILLFIYLYLTNANSKCQKLASIPHGRTSTLCILYITTFHNNFTRACEVKKNCQCETGIIFMCPERKCLTTELRPKKILSFSSFIAINCLHISFCTVRDLFFS